MPKCSNTAYCKAVRPFGRLLATTPEEISADSSKLLGLLEESVMVKSHIVEQDLNEGGIRKALNLGHTVGHAFEAYSLRKGKPMPHGYAVARGLVTELVLSHMTLGFPSERLHVLQITSGSIMARTM